MEPTSFTKCDGVRAIRSLETGGNTWGWGGRRQLLYNLRTEVGRNSQPRVNREQHLPRGSDRSSIGSRGKKTRSLQNLPEASLEAGRHGQRKRR